MVQTVKNLPTMQETQVQFLGREDPLEKGMAIHSSILAWRIPWSLAGCSPPGRKESDTTEWLTQRLIRYYSIQNTFNLFIFTWYIKIRILCNLINHLSSDGYLVCLWLFTNTNDFAILHEPGMKLNLWSGYLTCLPRTFWPPLKCQENLSIISVH